MATLLLVVSAVLASAGAAALLLIWRRWEWVEGFAHRSQAKLAVALCRAALAWAGLWSKEAATMSLAILGWLAWEIADWWAAEKLKVDKESAEAVKRKSDFRFHLLLALNALVHSKIQGIRHALRGAGRVLIARARAVLDPEGQITTVLRELALFLFGRRVGGHADARRNFCVSLFVEADGVLAPAVAFDLASRRAFLPVIPVQRERHYRLDNTADPIHAVLCLRERRLMLVPDCAAGPVLQHDPQVKSLAVYPIMSYRQGSEGDTPAVLTVETDAAGHFREEDREELEALLSEFAARLLLEEAIREALSI